MNFVDDDGDDATSPLTRYISGTWRFLSPDRKEKEQTAEKVAREVLKMG